jgi:hypothetical protein
MTDVGSHPDYDAALNALQRKTRQGPFKRMMAAIVFGVGAGMGAGEFIIRLF